MIVSHFLFYRISINVLIMSVIESDWMAWPPSAMFEGGARRVALGGTESEPVPTEPIQTQTITTVVQLPFSDAH